MIRNLASLRALLVCTIFVHHTCFFGFPFFGLDYQGELSVSCFFVLSGFVLSLRYGPEVERGTFGHKAFFKRQLAKFYPLHLILLLMLTVVNHENVDSTYLLKMLPTVVLMQSWIPDESFYYSGYALSWFLSSLLFSYAVFPWLYKAMHLSGRKFALTIVAAIAAYVAWLLCVPEALYNDHVFTQPVLRSFDFAIGILAQRLYAHLNVKDLGKGKIVAAEVAVVVLYVVTWRLYPHVDNRFHCAMLLWPVALAATLMFALADRYDTLLTRLMHCTPLLWLGGISFEIYMLHLLVFFSVRKWGLVSYQHFYVSVACLFVLTVAMSYATKHWYVDKIYRLLTR